MRKPSKTERKNHAEKQGRQLNEVELKVVSGGAGSTGGGDD